MKRIKDIILDELDLSKDENDYLDTFDKTYKVIIELVKRRIDLNLSQRDLSKLCGIKQPMIARIEKLETIPRIDTLVSIAKALKMNLSFEDKNEEEYYYRFDSDTIPYKLDIQETEKIEYKTTRPDFSYIDGNHLREFRKAHKMSQALLADYLGVTRVEIEKWEQGKSKLNPVIIRMVYLIEQKPELLDIL